MVMKRSSDSETLSKSKRIRSRGDFDDGGIRDRLSSPDSARDSSSPIRRSSSLSRKPDERTYKRSTNINMRNDNNYQSPRKRVDREPEAHIRVTNIASTVGDQPAKEGLFHEFKKFGDISVHLIGRGEDRYALVYFRNIDDAREVKRVIERRGRIMLFDRPLHLEFHTGDRTSSERPSSGTGRSYSPNEFRDYRSLSPSRRTQRSAPPVDYERSRGDYDSRSSKNTNRIGYSHPPNQPYIAPEDDPKATRTLFVGNLETSVSSMELRRAFERFGVVLDVDIKRPVRGQGNTYAFVKFADLDVAAKARYAMQGEIIGRNRVKIGYGKSQQTTRLWVGGLGPWTSIVELEREFDRFGAIRRTDYKKGDDHAYVLYDSLDAASVAAREMRGFSLNGRRLRIDFADKDQGLKDYVQFYPDHRPASPSRSRPNNADRVDLYGLQSDHRHYNDGERLYSGDRKREPSPIRHSAPAADSDFRSWRDNSDLFRREFDRRDGDSRSFGSDSWPRHEQDLHLEERNNWNHRGQDRPSKGQQYKQRGPRTPPPVDNYTPVDHSPEKDLGNNRTRKRRAPSPYKTRECRENEIPQKHRRNPRTRSPSPQHMNHSRPSTPLGNHHRSASSDSRFNRSRGDSTKSVEENEGPRTSDGESSLKNAANDKNDLPSPSEQKPATGQENQVSSGNETLQDLAKRFAVAWRGSLILKNSAFPVRMHLVGGNPEVADSLLRGDGSGSSQGAILRINQRLRLDQPKLEEVTRRINTAGASGHCLLLALPGVQTSVPEEPDADEPVQQRPLRNLMTYLKTKQAAGVVNLPVLPPNAATVKVDDIGVLHAFPPCQFSHEHLLRIAPHLSTEPSKEDHLVILVIRGSG